MSSKLRLAIATLSIVIASAYRVGAPTSRSASRAHSVAPVMVAVASDPATKMQLQKPPMPKAAVKDWEVHKFGGASLANAELYKQCSDLLIAESMRTQEEGSCTPTMAIVSAKGGVTDLLIGVVEASLNDMSAAAEQLRSATTAQVDVVRELAGDDIANEVEKSIRADEEDILNVVKAVSLLRTIPAATMELVTGYGEVWSAMTMHAYLQSTGHPTAWLDAREVLVVDSSGGGLGEKGSSASTTGTDPLWEKTAELVTEWFAKPEHAAITTTDCTTAAPIVVVTGFVAATLEGTPTTLKRSGSDYSATIFARLMGASRITMWKNVNGVYTADPRRVPEAFPIETLKYDEAIELAFFGAQVVHPSAMAPCIEESIPIYVRNIFNVTHPGTVIQGRACSLDESARAWSDEATSARAEGRNAECQVQLREDESPIKGITSIDNVAILNIEGTGASAVPDLAGRLFSALSRAAVSPIMVTQASADSSICIVVEEGVVDRARAALTAAFDRELAKGDLGGIQVEYDHSVVAIIGEGMAFRPGTGATFTGSMANAGVNIRCIAQGSSERQISIVVERDDCTRAVRAAHAALALSKTQLSVAVIGASGAIGSEFLNQLVESRSATTPDTAGKRKTLADLQVDLKVTALARSGKMRLSYDGLDVSKGHEGLLDDADADVAPTDLEALTRFLNEDFNGNRVVIDCTASQDVADYYARWLRLGINVVTANKLTGSGDGGVYDECRRLSEARAQWFYETTGPGSGLPVLTTLKDMTQSGDRVYTVQGIFSGTVSYILNELRDGKTTFSAAVRDAVEMGLCEPDPRDDLNGEDVARKVLVVARELGLELEMENVECDTLMPAALATWQPDTSDGAPPLASQLCDALEPYDAEVAQRVAAMMADGNVPVQLAKVDVRDGTASVKAFVPYAKDERMARCAGNEVIVEIESRRYSAAPMVLTGPGSGIEITSSGLFSDVLRLSRTLIEWNIPKIV